MELVGRVVRKEFNGVGLCSGTVQAYDPPSGYYKIVYVNGVSGTSKLAELAAALVTGEEGRSEETTPVQVDHPERNKKRHREVMRNVDLNEGIPEDSGGNVVDLNRVPVETLGFDLNRAVIEPDEGCLGYEESSSNKRRRLIDLNMDASFDLEEDAEVCDLSADKREERCFDLNVAVDVENSNDDELIQMNGDGEVQETNMQDENGVKDNLETRGCEEVNVAEVSSDHILEQNGVSLQDLNAPDANGAEGDHDLSENVANTVDEPLSDMETRLGRSSRRELAPIPASSTVTACLADEVSPSPSVNCLTDEQNWIFDGEAEDNGAEGDHDLPEHVDNSLSDRYHDGVSLQDDPEDNGAEGDHDLPEHVAMSVDESLSDRDHDLPVSSTVNACLADEVSPSPYVNCLIAEQNWIIDGDPEDIYVLSPKPQLPPSSASLNLDGLPVLYVFATYSFLRSFSTVLFLSPFELKDFVEALRCTTPSLLFDSIHVAVLQIIRKGLEKLADEDDESATLCLRSLDWDMLDVVNYPLYVVEYLLFSGSKDCPGADLTRFNFFRNEYFRLPMDLKIEILTCLCGDMRAAEVVRSELNKRSSNDGVVGASFDRNSADCSICKMDGKLMCCGGCPSAYHSKCVGVACDLLPEGVWYCPECSFDRCGSGWKPEKKIQGSKFIEIDPHGRKYYSSCGYLLVIDTDSVNYYHANDVILVLEQLKSCGRFYDAVTSAINKHWNVPVKAPLSAPENQATSGVKNRLEETSSNGGSHLRCHRTRRNISGSATGPDILNMSSEGSAETAHNGLDVMEEPNMTNTRTEVRPNALSESGYRNQYIFAQMTTAISEEMARNSRDSTNDMGFDEVIASAQVKTILMKTNKFQWRSIQGLYLDAWKEKCGWCHSCKSEDAGSEKNCLFNMSLGALRGPSEREIANSQPTDEKSHLMAIIWQLFSMESRLQGLLVGPWLNPQYSSIWREHILKASSISSLRHLLIEFEANLHHLVLSPQWLNHVDSAVEMGSSTHVLLASTGSSSKTTIGKRRGTSLESGVNPTAKKYGGLAMSWWRGGRLSRQLFNWKVLPRSLVSEAARQGGSVNIPGIMYPENSDPAKRSRRVAWEAAVESSTTSEQLGFQVRTLHSYIKWDDIENSHLLLASDNESKKSARQFKKVIVRRKCIEEETVKYLLDFKKRYIPQSRYIPDVVLQNGRMIEESSGERIKYWLNESYLPLHLLKRFEERKAVRKTSNPGGSSRHPEIEKVRKRSSEGKGFSYLFERAERSESSLCEQCKKDVSLSDAACCHICKRLFHKTHIRRADEEGMYICLPCKSEVLDEQPILRKRGSLPGTLRAKTGDQTQNAIPARKSPVSEPLRRSGRKPKQVIRLQDESQVPGGSEKQNLETEGGSGRTKKARKENSIRDKRSKRCSSYWLNGLRLSRKPGDERINEFWRYGCSKPLKSSGSDKVRRTCRLCRSIDSESESILIACEICEKWYHGDACGINEENSSMVIGFRCHHCRKLSPPSCPHM